ncbi:MAG: hypothetical protein PHU06_08330 [Gallionella sp.]|nr:hypothetical protein [Gallionella sp.]MDD4958973.1 hypothetical protein [Gallionella sp.]
MTKESKHKIYITLMWASLMTLSLAMPHVGFMLYLVVIPLSIWTLYSLYLSVRKPELRANQLTRVSIWLLAVALVVGIHYFRHITTRQSADEVVAAIKSYTATHGLCPVTLDDVGFSQEQLQDSLGMAGYGCDDGNPHFFYKVTYIVFDTYSYDFSKGVWKYRG